MHRSETPWRGGAAGDVTLHWGDIRTDYGVLRVGGNSLWSEYLNGLIDEVRIYNRALNATEIRTDMTTPL
ncbi:LamG-like jellyroll fold domain-containing protein [[Actinomadura] parvosata]|uniref:LamG-like jellyroll fold domain-containing protein n=1 Tax=[Actinomadura] parvosata TaxID=1955412 RepID=UPI00406C3150